MSRPYKLLIEHARQVVRVTTTGAKYLTGDSMKDVAVLEGAPEGYSIVVAQDGTIVALGPTNELADQYMNSQFTRVIDATGQCVVPGFVDSHTHSVWAGDRVHEYAMKLAGATYMDIHKAGGGIHFTVEHTRKAKEDDLYTSFRHRLEEMVSYGTTLVECKSGYGLDTDTELKMLRVIERAKRDGCPDISSTYCGAHAVPKGKTPAEATRDVIDNQLPALSAKMHSGDLHVDNIDVFCEQGVFDVEQTREILTAGQKLGLNINYHGEELHRLNSPEMMGDLGALAISHLEEISQTGIQAMAKSHTAAVILPTTAYTLRLKPPPVRAMLQAGVVLALGSDLNPNAHCMAMPMVMNLACVTLGMSMTEALIAATLNSAYALGQSHMHGSLEVGKLANLVLLEANSWEHIIYQLGSHSNVISAVVHRGTIVHERKSS